MARFTDAQLIQMLQKAARRVNAKMCLFNTDDEIVVDNAGELTPDDGELQDLVLLQAECMIVQREFVDFLDPDNADAGVLVKDGEQTVNTSSGGSAKSRLLCGECSANPCSELKERIGIAKMNRLNSGKLIW